MILSGFSDRGGQSGDSKSVPDRGKASKTACLQVGLGRELEKGRPLAELCVTRCGG